jgi:hypothetical protein
MANSSNLNGSDIDTRVWVPLPVAPADFVVETGKGYTFWSIPVGFCDGQKSLPSSGRSAKPIGRQEHGTRRMAWAPKPPDSACGSRNPCLSQPQSWMGWTLPVSSAPSGTIASRHI